MKIALATWGTRGDIQPYLVLALGLKQAGYDVTLAAPANFEKFITEHGIPFATVCRDTKSYANSENFLRVMNSGSEKDFVKEISKYFYASRDELRKNLRHLFETADVVIVPPLHLSRECACLSEKFGIPLIIGSFTPVLPRSSYFPNIHVTQWNLPFRFMNRATHTYFYRREWMFYKENVNEFRQELGLKPLKVPHYETIQNLSFLHFYSPNLFSPPQDWSKNVTVTGPLLLSNLGLKVTGDLPSEKLVKWLAAGSPPVFFSMGSLPVLKNINIGKILSEVADDLGLRFIIDGGWSDLNASDFAERIMPVKGSDHEWLFPQCRAIVHHGGAGTTLTAAMAEVPSIVCSVLRDQPFWGKRIQDLGVGFHLPFKSLSASSLKNFLVKAQDPDVIDRCQTLGQKIRSENGLSVAVKKLEQIFSTF